MYISLVLSDPWLGSGTIVCFPVTILFITVAVLLCELVTAILDAKGFKIYQCASAS